MRGGVADANSEYVPKEWQCGDVVTADALNNIEQGIQQALDGGGGASDEYNMKLTLAEGVSYFPNNITSAEKLFFRNVTVGQYANYNSLKKLTCDNVTFASGGNFYNCELLEEVQITNTKALTEGCFSSDTALKRVYIDSTCTTIPINAFNGVTQSNLTIDCGFAEGQVSGAPWGATNATINYNVPEPTL